MAAMSLNLREKYCVVVPTNAIADITVIEDSIKYSDVKNPVVVKIPANKRCIFNQELIEKYPILDKLPMLPITENCDECDYYDNCEITEILRVTAHGIAVTYAKLVALTISSILYPDSKAADILETIFKSKNFILDEVHEMQYGKSVSITIYSDSKKSGEKRFEMAPYMQIVGNFPNISMMLSIFDSIIKDRRVESAMFNVYSGSVGENYTRERLSIELKNSWSDYKEDKAKFAMSVYAEIIELAIRQNEFDAMTMPRILKLYDMLAITTNEKINVNAIRSKSKTSVMVTGVDNMFFGMIESFIRGIQNREKRVIMTSATICSHDYGAMFGENVNVINKTFGLGGDPMQTNEKMMILTDKKKIQNIGRYSLYGLKDEMLDSISKILAMCGADNCFIVALNRETATELQLDLRAYGCQDAQVDYYKSPKMMGVSSTKRVMVAVGMAYKPANSFDAISDNSKILLEEAVHCDTWQAWSRAKDPAGAVPSLVFALGCTKKDCMNAATWGFNRSVSIEYNDYGNQKTVEVGCDGGHITMPEIKQCNDMDEMLIAGADHGGYDSPIFTGDKEMKAHVDKMNITTVTDSKEAFLLGLFNRLDAHGAYTKDGRPYTAKHTNVSMEMIRRHISHDITIGVHSNSTQSTSKWIGFDIDAHKTKKTTPLELIEKQLLADKDILTLQEYLTDNSIPWCEEKSGTSHSYHMWIIVEEVDSGIAKEFGEYIRKQSGISKDTEVFPKRAKIAYDEKKREWKFGSYMKLPCALHRKTCKPSKMLINGTFTDEFETITYGRIDISSFVLPETVRTPRKRTKTVAYENSSSAWTKRIRPCIEKLVLMGTHGLGDGRGHYSRIAIVREFYNFGITDVDTLANLFSTQIDFNYDKTVEKIESIISSKAGIYRRDTLKARCGDLIDCTDCNYMKCKQYDTD